MKFQGKENEYLEVGEIDRQNQQEILEMRPSELLVILFEENGSKLIIDSHEMEFDKGNVLFLTEFHKVAIEKMHKARYIKWNKYFYCVINHDSEVGCKGILFYGAVETPVIQTEDNTRDNVLRIWNSLEDEMQSSDSLQKEMLENTLKRLLILFTRAYKNQQNLEQFDHDSTDIIREYNFLVEQYFKEKHSVAEYADMLNKSPKTLSNLFKKMGSKSPMQFIKDRKILEARRLLDYSDFTISEIGYDLGFSDVQSFSRFFKRETGTSPKQYKDDSKGKVVMN